MLTKSSNNLYLEEPGNDLAYINKNNMIDYITLISTCLDYIQPAKIVYYTCERKEQGNPYNKKIGKKKSKLTFKCYVTYLRREGIKTNCLSIEISLHDNLQAPWMYDAKMWKNPTVKQMTTK